MMSLPWYSATLPNSDWVFARAREFHKAGWSVIIMLQINASDLNALPAEYKGLFLSVRVCAGWCVLQYVIRIHMNMFVCVFVLC